MGKGKPQKGGLQKYLIGEKQAEKLKEAHKKNKEISKLKLEELRANSKATLLKARETVRLEKLVGKILRRKGLLGLGGAIGTAVVAGQKELEK